MVLKRKQCFLSTIAVLGIVLSIYNWKLQSASVRILVERNITKSTNLTNLEFAQMQLQSKNEEHKQSKTLADTQGYVTTELIQTSPWLVDQYPLQYMTVPPNNASKKFNVDVNFIKQYALPQSSLKENTDSEVFERFVFVMGISGNHMVESKDAVASVQKYFPDKKLLYFNWGLAPYQVDEISSWCNVELRPFNFSAIPVTSHLNTLTPVKWHYQAVKVFAVLEALRDHPAAFWLDASIRLHTSNLTEVFDVVKRTNGFSVMASCRHSTFAVTPPGVFDYLPPTNLTLTKTAVHAQTGAVFYARTKQMYQSVLWWLLLCSSDPDCILAQGYTTRCRWPATADMYTRKMFFARCTRVDQSIINLLVGNLYNYDWHFYCVGSCGGNKHIISISRHPTYTFQLQKCEPLSGMS